MILFMTRSVGRMRKLQSDLPIQQEDPSQRCSGTEVLEGYHVCARFDSIQLCLQHAEIQRLGTAREKTRKDWTHVQWMARAICCFVCRESEYFHPQAMHYVQQQ